MSETMKRFLGVASIETVAPSKGELIVVAPTLAQLADTALRAHNEVEKAALTAVLKAIEAGKGPERHQAAASTWQLRRLRCGAFQVRHPHSAKLHAIGEKRS